MRDFKTITVGHAADCRMCGVRVAVGEKARWKRGYGVVHEDLAVCAGTWAVTDADGIALDDMACAAGACACGGNCLNYGVDDEAYAAGCAAAAKNADDADTVRLYDTYAAFRAGWADTMHRNGGVCPDGCCGWVAPGVCC